MSPMWTSYPPWLMYMLAGVLGAILGSFANVCIARMPSGQSVIWPASHCPLCNHRLSWWENIPLISFFGLKGRCKICKGRISTRYPLVEMVCIALSLLLWWHLRDFIPYVAYYCLLIVPLVIVTFIDLSHRIIPDIISIPGIFVGIGVHTLFAEGMGYKEAAIDSIAGALVGSVFLFTVAYVYEKIKKREGLGGGDIKLIAMLGAFFGWRSAVFMLFISSVIGSLVGVAMIIILRKNMKFAIPFGPFLALAGTINLFLGDKLILWYTNLLG